MSAHKELPPEFVAGPFLVGTAKQAGIGEGRLRGHDLSRPFHGVRAPAPRLSADGTATTLLKPGADPTEMIQRCSEYAPLLLPGQHFSHTTAAQLWNVPLPRDAQGGPLHVTSMRPVSAPRRAGIVGHQVTAGSRLVLNRFGFPASSAPATWIALATLLSLDDLVAAGDALILDPHWPEYGDLRPHTSLAALEELTNRNAWRGRSNAAAAIPLLRAGAESRPESLVRLLLWRAGLPESEVNSNVRDAHGNWLGRADLFWRKWRTILEYDGEHHRTSSAQYNKDERRIENFMLADYTVVRVRSTGLFLEPQDTVDRVTRALTSRGWRP